jgi:hypothetical protein
MRVRILLQITADDGAPGEIEEIASLNKATARAEDLGFSLAEGKRLLSAVQQRLVEEQVKGWAETRRCCDACGHRRRGNGSYPIVFHTLYGDVRLASPRFRRCTCDTKSKATVTPLVELIPRHVAPERLYLETRWAALVPYAATAELLADVLPIPTGANATTIRDHVLQVAQRSEAELLKGKSSFLDGCPADWERLPIPGGRMVVGLDGGYVRDCADRTNNFEVIVGRSMAEDRSFRYVGFVNGLDRDPKRRLIEMLNSQGVQSNQDITFLTDGGKELLSLTDRISPCGEHVLDWFHITMKITVLGQFAKGVSQCDEAIGAQLTKDLERIKWKLWHGNVIDAQALIDEVADEVACLEVGYENQGKFAKLIREFRTYIASNVGSLINYGERYRAGEHISSAFVESTVNAVVSKRFAKKQQMQWSQRGAHLLLQARTRALDGTLRPMFERWYPGMADDNDMAARQAQAA